MAWILNDEIREVKKEMSVLSSFQSKGVLLRSKEREIEEGENVLGTFLKR